MSPCPECPDTVRNRRAVCPRCGHQVGAGFKTDYFEQRACRKARRLWLFFWLGWGILLAGFFRHHIPGLRDVWTWEPLTGQFPALDFLKVVPWLYDNFWLQEMLWIVPAVWMIGLSIMGLVRHRRKRNMFSAFSDRYL